MKKTCFAVVWLCLLTLLPAAQDLIRPRTPPPALLIQVEEGKSEPLGLTRLAVDTRILGVFAETRMTMTFYNPMNRVLEGDLYVPLPEGAAVSGYALDINGVMVDGVVVEKEKARRVFETIVRQGIDPGLVEYVKGNNFKTRVYPIPAKGTRTVMIRYLSETVFAGGETTFYLPLPQNQKIKEFSLRVEVVKAPAAPVVRRGGLSGFSFGAWRDSFVAETRQTDIQLPDDLLVALPDTDKRAVMVEKAPDGAVYFCLADVPAVNRSSGKAEAPKRITLLWDASGSRGKGDHQAELEALKAWFGRFPAARIAVDLVIFRNDPEKPQPFVVENGDASLLLATLGKVQYDGGTRLAAITPAAGVAKPDFFLLFSDGIGNFGAGEPAAFGAPLFALSADVSADHPWLRWLAMQNGGAYLNLKKMTPMEAAAAIGEAPFQLLKVTVASGQVAQCAPGGTVPVVGRLALTGRLESETARLILHYGVNGRETSRKEIEISRRDAAEGGLLRVAWAQKVIDDLLVLEKKNEKALVDMGERYGLVTPGTSLLVLDSVEQYVRYRIAPPESLPEMRKEYEQRVAAAESESKIKELAKLDRIRRMWDERVKWWETKFDYPEDLKYTEQTLMRTAGGERPRNGNRRAAPSGGGGGGRGATTGSSAPAMSRAPEPVRQAEMATDAMAAPAPMAERDEGGSRADGAMAKGVGGKDKKLRITGGEDEQPTIELKAWSPDTPYLKALEAAAPAEAYNVYLKHRAEFGNAPGFFLDCADFFFRKGNKELGLRVLSNIAELQLEDAPLLRVMAHRLAQLDYLDLSAAAFEDILKLRPEEPQSWRDLALVLGRNKEYGRALELLNHVVMNQWDRFDGIEVIALMELNAMLPKAVAAGVKKIPVDPSLIKLLDVDVRIILTWDADLTDMDLWVTEPSGEKAFYSHPRTQTGGNVSKDFTQGYGPEEYCVRKALHGKYKIEANYFGSRAQTLQGPVTLQVDFFTNFGRPDEQRKSITLRLKDSKETVLIGEVTF